MFGPDRFATNPPSGTTDDRGEFALENCEPGPSIVTVQAEGYAPRFRDVRVEAGAAPVVITLPEPGATLRVKVVDVEGKPVAGAILGVDTWRGHRSLEFRKEAGADGRIEWRSAPRDVMLCDVFKPGYMSSRELALTASDREHVVTLYPELVISGRVTDAETGRPLPTFRLIRGRKYKLWKETRWDENEAVVLAGGRYSTRFHEPCEAFFVRVDAPGYQPAESRAFHSTDKSQTFDVALRRGGGLSAVVLRPDGQPAAGAEVVLATERNGLLDAGGTIRSQGEPAEVHGRPRWSLHVHPAEGRVPHRRRLRRGLCRHHTGRAGEVGQAGVAAVGEDRGRGPDRQSAGGAPGGLVWTRLLASRETDLQPHLRLRHHDGRARPVHVRPGGPPPGDGVAQGSPTPSTDSGFPRGAGRHPSRSSPVRRRGCGSAATAGPSPAGSSSTASPRRPSNWTKNQPVVIRVRRDSRRFAADLDKDGGFRIEDVPPGLYVLRLPVDGPLDPQTERDGDPIGLAMMDLIVPEAPASRPDQPFALGTITAKALPDPQDRRTGPGLRRRAARRQGTRRSAQAQR